MTLDQLVDRIGTRVAMLAGFAVAVVWPHGWPGMLGAFVLSTLIDLWRYRSAKLYSPTQYTP